MPFVLVYSSKQLCSSVKNISLLRAIRLIAHSCVKNLIRLLKEYINCNKRAQLEIDSDKFKVI